MKRFVPTLFVCMLMVLPLNAQITSTDHLLPSDYKSQYEQGRVTCWGHKIEPSFIEGYEIRCIYVQNVKTFQLELKIDHHDNVHILPIDEKLAFDLFKLIDAAVKSSSHLPDKEWTAEAIDSLKKGKDPLSYWIGEDGANYYFCNYNQGAYCWSPDCGNNETLVKIGTVLYEAIVENDLGKISEQQKLISSLTKAYIEQMPAPYQEFYTLRNQMEEIFGWWLW